MKLAVAGVLCLSVVAVVVAQERATGKPDPRVGLKPGLRDAGEAARGLERISGLFKPEGFFDPKVPGGTATPPERPRSRSFTRWWKTWGSASPSHSTSDRRSRA
jgi:hypothetical protein